jgi:hypothetical protein
MLSYTYQEVSVLAGGIFKQANQSMNVTSPSNNNLKKKKKKKAKPATMQEHAPQPSWNEYRSLSRPPFNHPDLAAFPASFRFFT